MKINQKSPLNQVGDALTRVQRRYENVASWIGPQTTHDEMAELIMQWEWFESSFRKLQAIRAEIKGIFSDAFVKWRDENEEGCKKVSIGEVGYYASPTKVTKLLDPNGLLIAVTLAAVEKSMDREIGDTHLEADIKEVLELIAPYLSTSAVKQGAAKSLLGKERHGEFYHITTPETLKTGAPNKDQLKSVNESIMRQLKGKK